MMDFDEDLLTMFDPSVFGEYIELPNGSTITGILDLNPLVIEQGQTEISSNTQLLLVRTSDIMKLQQDDELKIRGEKYSVSDIRPDGTGLSELTVHKT